MSHYPRTTVWGQEKACQQTSKRSLKVGQHFDVPYDYEGLGKVRVVSCVNNYVSQFRIGQGKDCPFTYKVTNCKKEKGGYSRVSMHKADEQ